MEKRIKIITGELKVEAELNESKTAQLIWEALPIEGKNNLWGEEIYFAIPVKTGSEQGARDVVSAGELGYWPPGHAFCIFFGPTTVSDGPAPRAYSPVNVLGRVIGDATAFRGVRDGMPVRIIRAEA